MFVPLHKTPDWRNPPLVTLALMLLLSLSYAVLQHNDPLYEQEAYTFYFRSSLPDTELPRYVEFVRTTSSREQAARLKQELAAGDIGGQIAVFHAMQADGEFQTLLQQDLIISPDDPLYPHWQQERSYYESSLQKISAFQFGLIPSQFSAYTLVTHIFLHANLSHLLFNLLFLFLFGFIVEMAWGRWATLGTFLLSGILSGAFYVWLEPESARWGIGASGAIAGLAGAYTVLFGMRRIRFFFFLFVYFDYVSAPALALLPLWLAYEIYDYFWAMNNVNNLAHIGGLLSGAGIAWLLKTRTALVKTDFLDSEIQLHALESGMDRARKQIAHLEFGKARQTLQSLQRNYPEEPEITLQLFHIAKLEPASAEFHELAHMALQQTGVDEATLRRQHTVYVEYIRYAANSSRLSVALRLTLLQRFISLGELASAETLAHELLKDPDTPPANRLAPLIRRLIKAYEGSSKASTAKQLEKLLQRRAPGPSSMHSGN